MPLKPIKKKISAAKHSEKNRNKTSKVPPVNLSTEKVKKLFPIVAIGASAGGLEAYSIILNQIPSDTGMAFVIIQHSSPDYKSMLTDILERKTGMKVLTIKHGMKPQPNTVYVAPPTFTISFDDGTFNLSRRGKRVRSYLPIDLFMKSLSNDELHYTIGVILSGTDSDGVMGLEYIKASGGITYAQDKSAKFFDMPENAIKAGVVDFVLSPEEIAKELNRVSRNLLSSFQNLNEPGFLGRADDMILKILSILHFNLRIDFKQYKPSTIRRRILRRMLMHKISDLKEYIKFLSGNLEEIKSLCEDLLIHVTKFFRDPKMYECLKREVFPKLMKGRSVKDPIRIWVTACSTGEEAYSMAISLVEYLGEKASTYQIQIFSTDLNEAAIDKARAGIYPEEIKTDVSEERLIKYFIKGDGKYEVNQSIREICVFAKQNLIKDPPFSKIDLVSCRNVLIYMGDVLQNKIFPVFHYALKPKGFLVLGTSETVGNAKNLFEPIDKKYKIYIKKPSRPDDIHDSEIHEIFRSKLHFNEPRKVPVSASVIQKDVDTLILLKYTPAGVIVNKDMEILHVRGNVEPYLGIQQGKPNYNLLKMSRQGLGAVLKEIKDEVLKNNLSVRKNNVRHYSKKSVNYVNIIAEPFSNNLNDSYILILFEDAGKVILNTNDNESITDQGNPATIINKDRELTEISKELVLNKEHLQSIVEQLEGTNEELRTANEEIQTSNEELQSSNEELEITKEELQSANEGLTTVNDEMQVKNRDLQNAISDLGNLLTSIKGSVIMLDNSLKIRRFTEDAAVLLNLIKADIGRNITDINFNIKVKNLKDSIQEVMDTSVAKEIEVRNENDFWYLMKIRPYRTSENKIEGILISLVDITENKKSAELKQVQQKQIELLNLTLEKNVKERTSQLEKINKQLEQEVQDRKNVEASLRILSKNLIDGQEVERLKISRELHDGVNQILSAAKLKVHTAENKLKGIVKNKSSLKPIVDARAYINRAMLEIRRVSQDLRPSSLDEIGIIAAVNSIIEEFTDRTKIKVNFENNLLRKRFSADIELVLYRIIQEGLHNIQKHSRASNVKVALKEQRSSLKLAITDNGRGFDIHESIPKSKTKRKLGIMGIKERVESVGGKFLIKAEKNLGTRIEVNVPVGHKLYNAKKQ